jgi:CYTH domain-containing protein
MEFEKTYLAKYLPQDLKAFPHKEIIDIYFPAEVHHPTLRIRMSGDKYQITKKWPMGDDHSQHLEHNADITKEEFESLAKASNRRLHKMRYYYPIGEGTAEVDVFFEQLEGLVVVDVEFNSADELSHSIMPEFCLVDVTQDEWLAGGVLSGLTYSDIESTLTKYNYQKLILP